MVRQMVKQEDIWVSSQADSLYRSASTMSASLEKPTTHLHTETHRSKWGMENEIFDVH